MSRGKRRREEEDRANKRVKYEWGKPEMFEDKPDEDEVPEDEKEKPNFKPSGNLTKELRTYKGVEMKYMEPEDKVIPSTKWRLYVFKGKESLEPYHISKKTMYLFGRDRSVCDIPVDHPSCSKQHAVIQFRSVRTKDGKRERAYLMDLNSTNGTHLNGSRVDGSRYIQLLEKDSIKFGFSSREYIILSENAV
mmetsp:Transcript_23322/g.25908  ORF Transcript_23322/g.25908 Transcript_23322/m.25908 type:complete len:192 (+) Transcript_23322:226-801(+)